MAALSREQVARYLYDAGFRGDDLTNMVAIAGRESGYQPDAHRTDQPKSKLSGDLGLFQINYTNWNTVKNALGLTSKDQLFDPFVNAQAAKVLFDASGYFPWNMTAQGWNANGDPFYGTNRTAAATAVSNFLNNPGAYTNRAVATSAPAPTPAPTPAPAPERKMLDPADFQLSDPVERTNTIADYVAPTADPEQQAALTSLLQGFGIDYPDAPRATPQLLMFMRGLGMSVDTADENFDTTRAGIERRKADALGDLKLSNQRRQRNIGIDAQRRGALVSGATNLSLGRAAEDYARSQADVERESAEAIDKADRLRSTITDDLRQDALERTLNEETSQDIYDAEQEARVEAAKAAQYETDLAYDRTRKMENERIARQIKLLNSGIS